jgi:hypothetical protein
MLDLLTLLTQLWLHGGGAHTNDGGGKGADLGGAEDDARLTPGDTLRSLSDRIRSNTLGE